MIRIIMRRRQFSIPKRKGKEIEVSEQANRANEAQRPQESCYGCKKCDVILCKGDCFNEYSIRKTPELHYFRVQLYKTLSKRV